MVPLVIAAIQLVDTPNQKSNQLTHSLSLSYPLSSSSLSLSTLSHTLKQGEGRERRWKGGGPRVTAADGGHGDHLEAIIHKQLGLEEGGALSPSPQGARRCRKQGARRFRVTKGERALGLDQTKQNLDFSLFEPKPRKCQFVTYL